MITRKKMPQVDIWFKRGSNFGWGGKPIAEAEAEFEVKPTPHELSRFRTGYQIGRINGAVWRIQNLSRDLNRSELSRVADDMEKLEAQYESEYFTEVETASESEE